jgi:protein-S-isoprenylcysteine O-methyltransferase Ste14
MLLIAIAPIFFFHIVFLLKTGFRADGPLLHYVDERPDRNSTNTPKLVTSGPYTNLRHPIYTGQILAMLGCAIGVNVRKALTAVSGEHEREYATLVA